MKDQKLPPIEFRSATMDAQSEENKVSGTAVVFGQKTPLYGGMYYEVIDRSAFDKCDMTDVKLLLDHDSGKVIARMNQNRPNRSTMEITIDEAGLHFEASLAVESDPDARSAYSKVSRGDLDQCSFGFTIRGYEWQDLDQEIPTKRITDIGKLYELSLVAFPAYPSTEASARSGGSASEDEKLALENARAAYAEAEKRGQMRARARARLNLNIEVAKIYFGGKHEH